jgi:hypothetical protein
MLKDKFIEYEFQIPTYYILLTTKLQIDLAKQENVENIIIPNVQSF